MLADVDPQNLMAKVGLRGHCIDCPAHRRAMLTSLTGESTDECAFDTRGLEPRQGLSLTSLPAGSLVLVRRGMVIRVRADKRGEHSVAIDALGSGGAFVVSGDGTDAQVYAVDRTLYCTLAGHTLLSDLSHDPKGLSDLHKLHSGIQYRLERLSDARGRSSVRSRVAATLCALADTLSPSLGRRLQFPAAFLQRDLAVLASTRYESICRILRDFSESGLVSHGPDGVVIGDYDKLAVL